MRFPTQFERLRRKGAHWVLALCLCSPVIPRPAVAQESDVLAECMALSGVDDDIHACLDNYLDVMDANLRDITSYIRGEFGSDSAAAFDRSQAAFESFRRENCLWYLQISSPRPIAEQIAKNCLARHSIDRLSELQGLLARDDASSQVVDGFYVFGANRNSFRPCGSDGRYQVAGDANAVADLQRRYINLASVDLQILFASVTGEVDNSLDGGPEHDGVINVSSIRDLRYPSDSDCNLPTGSPQVSAVSASDARSAQSVEERVAAIESLEPLPDELPANPVSDPGPAPLPPSDAGVSAVVTPEPAPAAAPAPAAEASVPAIGDEERLTAYFGGWLADCAVDSGERWCRLAVDMEGGALGPQLSLSRRASGSTAVELNLPGRDLDSIQQLSWGVDTYHFGVLPGSELRFEDQLTTQRLTERRFVNEELLPLMISGSELVVDIIGAADNGAPRYNATLIGLSRALAFADDYLGN